MLQLIFFSIIKYKLSYFVYHLFKFCYTYLTSFHLCFRVSIMFFYVCKYKVK